MKMPAINKIWLAIVLFYTVLFASLAFYDGQPSRNMLENLTRPLPEAVEAGNAWIAVYGFSAPQGMSPYAYGEKKMHGLRDIIEPGGSYKEQDKQVPDNRAREIVFKGEIISLNINKDRDILRYVREHGGEIRALERDNAILLRRYEELRNYPGYADPVDYGFSAPMPKFSSIRKTRILRLLLLAETAGRGRYAAALTGLRDDMNFWRFIAGNSRLIISKLTSISFLYQDIRIAAELGANLPLSNEERKIALDILRPFDRGETAMREVFRGEVRNMQKGMEKVYSLSRRTTERFFFKPNSSDNLFYKNWEDVVGDVELSPQQIAAKVGRAGNLREKIGFGFLYNPVGEILATIGKVDTSTYIVMGCDLEGYRRLALLKILVRTEKISSENIRKFVESHAADLGNPYNGEPMKWDPAGKTLYFNKLSGNGRVEIFL
jgi:hypothetical protein